MTKKGSLSGKKGSNRKQPGETAARAMQVARVLAKHYGDAECALIHENPFQLTVATILSAQCTDERVNAVTPKLFKRFPTAAKLAKGTQEEVEKIIHSLGFFRLPRPIWQGFQTRTQSTKLYSTAVIMMHTRNLGA